MYNSARSYLNEIDEDSRTALHWAASRNQYEIVRYLLDEGCSMINHQDDALWSPIHSVVSAGHTHTLTLLISYKAHIDTHTSSGQTPLILAAGKGHIDCCKCLLESGANVDEKDYQGNTALARASGAGKEEVISLLLRAGATTSIEKSTGDNPLHMAVNCQNMAVCCLLCQKFPELMDQKNKDGKTPLDVAHPSLENSLRSVSAV
eukprot:GHVR01096334.1.p1 GENE.GHVR01096334.1~~GHVR01096334.1.p1  ORF type:complete len:205 (+),score=52.45 GHVR01096334.1:76-690(+)